MQFRLNVIESDEIRIGRIITKLPTHVPSNNAV